MGLFGHTEGKDVIASVKRLEEHLSNVKKILSDVITNDNKDQREIPLPDQYVHSLKRELSELAAAANTLKEHSRHVFFKPYEK